MFITAVCVLFFIKLRWPKNKSLYSITALLVSTERGAPQDEKGMRVAWGVNIRVTECA